jgi:uncharacterized cupredoxin-like copper-binding protein
LDKRVIAALGCTLLFVAAPAWSHGGDSDKPKPRATVKTVFGQTGDPNKVDRTIVVDMSDRMRFAPATIKVKQGETIRFDIRNSGKTLHEMVLGSMDDLKKHAELMRKFPGMEHDEPYQAHVNAGKKGEMLWQFSKAGVFHYGCLIPGHFEAGMVGRVEVTP